MRKERPKSGAMRICMALFSCLLLAACGPRYVQDYDLFPPASASGKQCVTECTVMKESCEKDCYRDALMCERANNRDDYWGSGVGVGYGYGHRQRGSYWDQRFGSAFPSGSSGAYCSTASCAQMCREQQLQCHTNCGGTVQARPPRCVSGC